MDTPLWVSAGQAAVSRELAGWSPGTGLDEGSRHCQGTVLPSRITFSPSPDLPLEPLLYPRVVAGQRKLILLSVHPGRASCQGISQHEGNQSLSINSRVGKGRTFSIFYNFNSG